MVSGGHEHRRRWRRLPRGDAAVPRVDRAWGRQPGVASRGRWRTVRRWRPGTAGSGGMVTSRSCARSARR